MRYKLLLIALLFIAVGVVQADGNGVNCPSSYFGDWTGIDKVDGGEGHKRFYFNSRGTTSNIGNDSWHGPCGYGWPAKTFSDDLTCQNGKLLGDWNLDCQAPPTDVTGDRAFQVEYEIFGGGRLRETLINPDTGEPLGREPIVYTKGN